MNCFRTIYRYELKKITRRKLVWITLSICVLGIIFTPFSNLLGSYYVDGVLTDTHYHMFQVDSEYRRALSGRKIDQELLEETVAAYRQIPADADRYTVTEEYQTFARPYSEIFNLIRSWTNMDFSSVINWEPEEKALYEMRIKQLENDWQSEISLSDAEKDYWRERESQLNTPFTYYYNEGYVMLLNCFLTVGVLMLLFVSICLPGVFADEHARRTDQLMLSSAKGKDIAYWAKLAAGATLAAGCSTLMSTLIWGLTLGFYGAEGFHTSMQIYTNYSFPLTMGQACLIAYGILIITSVLMGVLVMFLSEIFHSSIAALAVSTGLIISGNIIMIPAEYRFLAQLWDCSPMAFLQTWNIFSVRLIHIFNNCFTRWQVVPVIYILCTVLIAAVGKRVFEQYQVSGR